MILSTRPFKRVLVANRGEIARRVIRGCRAEGLEAVAVYSEADAESLHVADADARFLLGPSPPRDSYLNVDRLLEAARRSGSEAVHPGYGFLAESAAFAEAVISAGLVWIGPSAPTIRDMGDKARARLIAAEAGIPILPGSLRLEEGSAESWREAAREIGFPVLLKAASGGGGIGMRRVDCAEDLAVAVAAAQGLATRFFGSAEVYLERFIQSARHIEVQIFGDGEGGAIHLFERDCSIQRRFQKLVEESPAHGIGDDVRESLVDCAVKLARTQAYRGAGTVEFLVDNATGQFFFLEMNTRIQVEHGVTEMVTAFDLVRAQLSCAMGGWRLPCQESITAVGHAIECRIYAENPQRGFLPSAGPLRRFDLPSGDGLRIDTGYRAGDVVTHFYDPLLAKVIVRGGDRADAIALMRRALEQTRIEGVATNVELLRRMIAHPAFQAGDIHTQFLDRQILASI